MDEIYEKINENSTEDSKLSEDQFVEDVIKRIGKKEKEHEEWERLQIEKVDELLKLNSFAKTVKQDTLSKIILREKEINFDKICDLMTSKGMSLSLKEQCFLLNAKLSKLEAKLEGLQEEEKK